MFFLNRIPVLVRLHFFSLFFSQFSKLLLLLNDFLIPDMLFIHGYAVNNRSDNQDNANDDLFLFPLCDFAGSSYERIVVLRWHAVLDAPWFLLRSAR